MSPVVIGHRGASGHRPEHTLAAYELAIELGADFVEPDLVSTRDGVLVARHENELGGTTDVGAHPELADRRTTKTIDGVAVSGWFSEDFTLSELKRLRARERIPQLRPANTVFDGRYEIPTLQEVLDLVARESARRGRRIGIYPETKHPTWFDSIGLSLEEPLVETLHRNGFRTDRSPVFIQSFEAGNLRELAAMTRLRLVQLVAADRAASERISRVGLSEMAQYAAGIGPDKDLVIPRDADGRLQAPTALVDDAHAAGLVVHAWTFRAENAFLPMDLRLGDPADPTHLRQRGDWVAEYAAFFATGLDGVFADQPELAVEARALAAR